MNTKNIVTSVIVSVVIVAVATIFFVRTNTVVERQIVGATPGTDITENCTSQGGVTMCRYKKSMNVASTTICSIIPDRGYATSTLVRASTNTSVSTTTAHRIVIAKGAVSTTATTTWLGGTGTGLPGDTHAANALSTILAGAATSTQTALDKYVFGPAYQLNFSMQGGVGTFSPTGFCEAEFWYN